MTDRNQTDRDAQPAGAHHPPRHRSRLFVILLVALAAGLAGAFASQAMSHGYGLGFGPGRWHHGGFMGGHLDPAAIEDRADRAVRHLAVEIDATSEQQEKLRAIVKTAVQDLLPIRDKARTARQRAHELLTQPTVDRAAIETFRAEQMALFDQASRRIAAAVGEAAEVLSPGQRSKLGELLPPRRGFWHGRNDG